MTIIEEYNELADQYECDHITNWDYDFHQMEGEKIKICKSCECFSLPKAQ